MSAADAVDGSSQQRRPIRLDLQLCYSGFKVEELQYIDYSRASSEPGDHDVEAYSSKLDGDISEDGDGFLMNDGEFEEAANVSSDDCRSYLCSTPTTGRKHRGRFPQVDLSGLEYVRSTCTVDSGLHGQDMSNSIVSVYGEDESGPDSMEDLIWPNANKPAQQLTRRKIELDSEMYNPYSEIGELELSIEEDISQSRHNSSALGSLRRRLSLKYFRRTTSTGLFGSYLQGAPDIPPSSRHVIANNAQTRNMSKPAGPMNLWFRKFRNRHFI